jgi:uncharacterized protein YacL
MHADVVLIRLIFTGILVAAGYILKPVAAESLDLCSRWWQSLRFASSCLSCGFRRATLKTLIGAAVGSILGILGAYLIGSLISSQESVGPLGPHVKTFITLSLTFFMAYVGLMVGACQRGLP